LKINLQLQNVVDVKQIEKERVKYAVYVKTIFSFPTLFRFPSVYPLIHRKKICFLKNRQKVEIEGGKEFDSTVLLQNQPAVPRSPPFFSFPKKDRGAGSHVTP